MLYCNTKINNGDLNDSDPTLTSLVQCIPCHPFRRLLTAVQTNRKQPHRLVPSINDRRAPNLCLQRQRATLATWTRRESPPLGYQDPSIRQGEGPSCPQSIHRCLRIARPGAAGEVDGVAAGVHVDDCKVYAVMSNC